MSLDSHIQIRDAIEEEINNWYPAYDLELTWDEVADLRDAIHNRLSDGGAFDTGIPSTVDYEDEHYN